MSQKINILYLVIITVTMLLFTFQTKAEAYLDPGTGNVLVYVIISLAGALLYASKSTFYFILKLTGKKVSESNSGLGGHQRLVIFGESKTYWNTFKPIVHALIKKRSPFTYYSMDVDDPALTIDNEFMNSKYIGNGSIAFHRMNKLHADILLATTPNIGTPGYPMLRSENVKSMVHVLHGIADISYYHKGSLDHYDVVLMNGEYVSHSIREVERKRGLKPKELLVLGMPYIDDLAKKIPDPLPATDGKTILVAPSWGEKGLFPYYGTGFIRELLLAEFNIILRPHPQSYKNEPNLFDNIHKELDIYPNFAWDGEIDASQSMAKADLMISDRSNVRMDFAFLYEKPVITFGIPLTDPDAWGITDRSQWDEWERSDLDVDWLDEIANKIGTKLKNAEEAKNIVQHVNNVLADRTKHDLSELRESCLVNFGHSGEAIADYLISSINKVSTAAAQEEN